MAKAAKAETAKQPEPPAQVTEVTLMDHLFPFSIAPLTREEAHNIVFELLDWMEEADDQFRRAPLLIKLISGIAPYHYSDNTPMVPANDPEFIEKDLKARNAAASAAVLAAFEFTHEYIDTIEKFLQDVREGGNQAMRDAETRRTAFLNLCNGTPSDGN
jgi:hypothetical protein